jgi:Molybdopterin-binding domain of aldehyde dehydrogenase
VVAAGSKAGGPSWPNGCHVCGLEVDPATGEVQLVANASVNDIGRFVSLVASISPGCSAGTVAAWPNARPRGVRRRCQPAL